MAELTVKQRLRHAWLAEQQAAAQLTQAAEAKARAQASAMASCTRAKAEGWTLRTTPAKRACQSLTAELPQLEARVAAEQAKVSQSRGELISAAAQVDETVQGLQDQHEVLQRLTVLLQTVRDADRDAGRHEKQAFVLGAATGAATASKDDKANVLGAATGLEVYLVIRALNTLFTATAEFNGTAKRAKLPLSFSTPTSVEKIRAEAPKLGAELEASKRRASDALDAAVQAAVAKISKADGSAARP